MVSALALLLDVCSDELLETPETASICLSEIGTLFAAVYTAWLLLDASAFLPQEENTTEAVNMTNKSKERCTSIASLITVVRLAP